MTAQLRKCLVREPVCVCKLLVEVGKGQYYNHTIINYIENNGLPIIKYISGIDRRYLMQLMHSKLRVNNIQVLKYTDNGINKIVDKT